MKNFLAIAGGCATGAFLAVLCFKVVSCTSGHYPAIPPDPHQAVIDSLNADYKAQKILWIIKLDSAHRSFEKAMAGQARKTPLKNQFQKDTAARHALKPSKKDSLIKIEMEVGLADSSKLTNKLADKVLDTKSENVLLHSYAKQDSATIMELMGAYFELDTANIRCGQLLTNRDSTIVQHEAQVGDLQVKNAALQNQVKKLKWWQIPLVGLGLLAGFLIGH